MNAYRHGDISFHPRKKKDIPKGSKSERRASYIAAYGEATGHHHELRTRAPLSVGVTDLPELLDLKELPTMTLHTAPDGRRFIEIDGGDISLTHQEHHTLTIVPGVYEILEERTFDYFENSIKKVID